MYPIAKTVRFECEMAGVPKPNITWYKNGEPLHINGRIKQKGWSLVLSNTVKEDSGIYQVSFPSIQASRGVIQLFSSQCRGWNEAGEVWASAKLTEQAGKQDSTDTPPTNLKCSNITTSGVLLSWDKIMPVTAYTIHYLPSGGQFDLDSNLE